MRVGILTFRWANNYGAVLQAYALQRYLQSEDRYGIVEIIDYVPQKAPSLASCVKTKHISKVISNIGDYVKARKIERFRREYLLLSKRYSSYDELTRMDPYDVIICGSDQIWNVWFTQNGEGKQTLSYFLTFCECKKIAYAASFGCIEYPEELFPVIKVPLQLFSALSVRESSAKQILKDMGFDGASVVADPTALLDANEYLSLVTGRSSRPAKNECVLYIVRRPSHENSKIIHSIRRCSHALGMTMRKINYKDMTTWLTSIVEAKFMVTDSFHGMMMCLKMHVPFAILLEKGEYSGMNDRFYTLLRILSLTDRIMTGSSLETGEKILQKPIMWDEVDRQLSNYVFVSKTFLEHSLA